MASAMASAAARNIPAPYTIPVGPRIRPPRLLPGTKAANTDPKPDEPPPTQGDVWVQGKWRNPGSRAARDRREVQSAKTEKALRHNKHGMNIYAYSHIRTNQVVYSLTRIMQNHKILSQLLYFGKQTKPAALRRDLWRPYFSIHFPETPAGAEAGLKAYQKLRELAIQRQLSPSPELLIATEEDVQKSKNRYDPLEFEQRLEKGDIKNHPVLDRKLPQKVRAKKLMDQKASSVADAAFVLDHMNRDLSPEEDRKAVLETREQRYQRLSKRALRRLGVIKEQEAVKEASISRNQEKVKAGEGHVGLTLHAAQRIALEYGGAVSDPAKGAEYKVKGLQSREQQTSSARELVIDGKHQGLTKDEYRAIVMERWKSANQDKLASLSAEEIEKEMEKENWTFKLKTMAHDWFPPTAASKDLTSSTDVDDSKTVQVLWADLRDATWAEEWSSNVFHGELEQRAALKHERPITRTNTTIDEDGNEVLEQHNTITVQNSTTPHVFGVNNQSGWYQRPEQLDEKSKQSRDAESSEWRLKKIDGSRKILDEMMELKRQENELLKQKAKIQPEFDALVTAESNLKASEPLEPNYAAAHATISNYTDNEKYALKTEMQEVEDNIRTKQSEVKEMEETYPTLHAVMQDLLMWHQGQDVYTNLLRLKDEVLSLQSGYESEDPAVTQRLQEIDLQLESYATSYPSLARIGDIQHRLAEKTARYHELETKADEPVAQPSEGELEATTADDLDVKGDIMRSRFMDARSEAWHGRLDAIEDTLTSIQAEDQYERSSVFDHAMQLVSAEQRNDTVLIESLEQEKRAKEDDWLLERLGLTEPAVEPVITEISTDRAANSTETADDKDKRERGIEQPPPAELRRGIMNRVMGLFRR